MKTRKIAALFMIVIITITSFSGAIFAAATGAPGTPSLAHDNWDGDGNFNITMNMWYGNNGTTYKLYENNVVVHTQTLTDNSPNAQTVAKAISGKSNGTYTYKCDLINSFGTITSSTITVNVTSGPSATNTPTPTNTPKSTPTNTPTNTPRPTNTPTNTPTNAPTNTPTNAPTNTPTTTAAQTTAPAATPLDGAITRVIDFEGESADAAKSNFGGTSTFAIENAAGINNSKCLSISSSTDVDATWFRGIQTRVGKSTLITAYVKGENLQGRGIVALQGQYAYIQNTTDWQKISFVIKSNENFSWLFCNLGGYGAQAKGKVYFDNIVITDYHEYDNLENGLTTWTNTAKTGTTYTLEQTTGVNNSKALSINAANLQDSKWTKTVNLETNRKYRLKAQVKLENVTSQVDMGAFLSAQNAVSSKVGSTGTSDYKEIFVDFELPKETAKTKDVEITLGLGTINNLAKGKVTFDEIKIVEFDQIIPEPSKKVVATIDFENGESAASNFGGGATFTIENSGGINNSKCLSIASATDVDSAWYKNVPIQVGKCYKVTAYVKGENLQGRGIIGLQGQSYAYIDNNTGWQKISLIWYVKDNYQMLFCNLGGYGAYAKGKVYFDNITIEEYENIVEFEDFEDQNLEWNHSNEPNVTYTVEQSAGVNSSKCLSISASDFAMGTWVKGFKLTPGKHYKIYASIKVENMLSRDKHLGGTISGPACVSSEGYKSLGTSAWQQKLISFQVEEDAGEYTDIRLDLGYYNGDQKAKGKVYFDNLLIVEDTEIVTQSGVHVKTAFEADDLTNITPQKFTAWIGNLDAAYEKMNDLVGGVPFNGKPMSLNSVTAADSVGWAYVIGSSRYMRWPKMQVKDTMVKINNGDWCSGVLHEMGHLFNMSPYSISNKESWEWQDDEMWANFRYCYALEALNGKVNFEGKDYIGADILTFFKTDAGNSYDKTIAVGKYSADGLMAKLLMIKNTIGWQPFKDTFRELNPKKSTSVTNFDKFQDFISVLDSKTSYNVRGMFTASEWNTIQTGI
ncbi:MAG: hypothetical protein N2645_00370 [Clostridia bacterium]|nr:hypothetical protein [Clostridia bacterium]